MDYKFDYINLGGFTNNSSKLSRNLMNSNLHLIRCNLDNKNITLLIQKSEKETGLLNKLNKEVLNPSTFGQQINLLHNSLNKMNLKFDNTQFYQVLRTYIEETCEETETEYFLNMIDNGLVESILKIIPSKKRCLC